MPLCKIMKVRQAAVTKSSHLSALSYLLHNVSNHACPKCPRGVQPAGPAAGCTPLGPKRTSRNAPEACSQPGLRLVARRLAQNTPPKMPQRRATSWAGSWLHTGCSIVEIMLLMPDQTNITRGTMAVVHGTWKSKMQKKQTSYWWVQ